MKKDSFTFTAQIIHKIQTKQYKKGESTMNVSDFKDINYDGVMDEVKKSKEMQKNIWKEYYAADMHVKSLQKSHVVDENQTVAWNKEHIDAEIKKAKAAATKIHNKYNSAYHNAENALISLIMNENHLTESEAKKCFERGYEDGHSEGFEEIVLKTRDYADFAEEIIDLSLD